MRRGGVVVYGLFAYLATLILTVYSIAFFGNLAIKHSLDSEPRSEVGWAICVNGSLFLLFGLQHSLMARRGFKRRLARYLPAAVERSTYLYGSCLALGTLFLGWQPIGFVLWDLTASFGGSMVYVIYFIGWVVIAWSICLMDQSDMFGLRQVWCYAKGRTYKPLPLVIPGPYRWVRHPMYLGWLLVFWASPIMTSGHFAFAIFFTLYILIAIRWEERDLVEVHGEAYQNYRSSVAMLFPLWKILGK
ncbi:MAG: isoprenylcysteine carboxylmethyltransferase family protein [Mariniblastus sp.]|nr:isoprenylcysteine carboxylmethyltransferase family protein [Mariniblastus sp.]